MKKLLSIIFFIPFFLSGQVTINPTTIEVDQPVTITVNITSTATNCNTIVNPTKVYIHTGVGNDTNPWTYVVGNWGQNDGVGEMTNMGGGNWSITFTPQTYFNLTAEQSATITKMGMVFRNQDGSQELKKSGCSDFVYNVGSFQMNLLQPNSKFSIKNSGESMIVFASHTNGSATYELTVNGVVQNTNTVASSYNYTISNITQNLYCSLKATQGTTQITKTFTILVNPGTISAALPNGLEDGINYDSDTSKATLVLNAPGKDFVYVAGNFNNWKPSAAFAMKKDATSGKFWLELSGLTPGQDYAYQYWVCDATPLTGSPNVVKTADPFSTLVLSPWDDPEIVTLGVYPGLPVYATIAPNQDREVTLLKTGQTPYNWQVTSFNKPKKEDLVIYEVLIRDFDTPRTFQSLIDRIDYFKNLKVNAIQLMPVMEFEGNESWGYNTVFHLALDKFYGPGNKLKEFIDLCHQNGIAVILDVALNHAFGRNPMVRMWMSDADGDGWGGPSSENPYFNVTATHSYGVGNDFNHSTAVTKNYVKRTIKQWVQEFKIDGFRWDLTKGFTQNATGSDYQTNAYQADRVAVLKEYADYSWSLDPNHYVIFEHLGTNDGSLTEETEWANYRYNEGKGIMLWGEMTWAYRQLTMGFNSSANITRMGSNSRGFTGKRLVGYPESHDKERLMYDNVTYGNSTNAAHNVKNLNTALYRMSTLGAASLLIPGPKMIWHFADLGMQNSVYTCTNGSVNTESDATAGDCKLATKPQPQWTENWLTNTQRSQIYNNWAKMIDLKINEPVFEGDYSIDSNNTNLKPRVFIWNDALPTTSLKNVVVLTNFEVTSQNIVPNFPYTGTWYNLMDNSTLNVSNTTNAINIEAGGFRVYGNMPSTLAVENTDLENFVIFPNPTKQIFNLSIKAEQVQIYDVTGKMVANFAQPDNNVYNIAQLKAGLYFVKIQTNNGTATQQLIVE